MRETQEQLIARKELKSALETLQEVAAKHKAAFCGFVFSIDPVFIMRFGNVSESGDDYFNLLRRLEEMSRQSIKAGNVVNDPLGEKGN